MTSTVDTTGLARTDDTLARPSRSHELAEHREPLDPARLRRAKVAYTTRFLAEHLRSEQDLTLVAGAAVQPRPGDITLARVVEIGQHKRLESPTSRRAALFVGDEVVVAYGHRYAPDQFEAEVPEDLAPAHLVAAGGVVGRVTAQHAAIEDATVLQPLGLLADETGVLTLERLAPCRLVDPSSELGLPRPRVVAVLGTSMNSGKSTTLACLVRGLVASGRQVSAGKVTGTGAGGDPGMFLDAGAARVLDFTDFGFPSTYRLAHTQVRALLVSMIEHLSEPTTDVVVLEIADGVYQQETARLIGDPVFADLVDHVVFAAADSLGAAAGVSSLQAAGLDVVACSGVVTASPLAAGEARGALGVPVIDTFDLTDPEAAGRLLS
ncbi:MULTISPECIES: hypothetical protein [Nocardioides]|uniref:hypothetical protein n=1 Tax=Nocardioides TaxID=1839 RepID=UPI000330836E|nr:MULTISPECIES: hypothetical protein [Nocardioides]EON24966.1 hypothetical protein CF8_0863 [Nocardioides sp. CF8]